MAPASQQDRPHEPSPRFPAIQAIPRWKTWLPLALIALILVVLLLAPILSYRATNTIAEGFSETVIPARIAAGQLGQAFARSAADIRSYAVTGDEAFLRDYHSVRSRENDALERLRTLAPRLGSEAEEQVQTLELRAERLHARHEQFLAGRSSAEEFLDQLPAQDSLFEDALATANRFGVAMDMAVAEQIDQLRDASGRQLLLTIVGAGLASVAVLLLVRIGLEMRRRTREETSLRNAALALAEAVRMEEVLRRIAASAVEAGYGENAHVERIDPDRREVEVVATAGPGAPPLGVRVPYPGSLAEEVIDTGTSEIIADVSREARPIATLVGERCGPCAGIVVPLMAEHRAQGALVLLRSAESPYRPRDILAPRILGVLAALALRRATLLHIAEERHEQLQRVMESKARLTRGLSHDLKNPLGAADGYVQLLEQGLIGDLTGRQKDSLHRVRESIRSAIDLINDLHELARAETGQLSIEPETTNVDALVRSLAEQHRAEAERAGLRLTVDRPGARPMAELDPRRVRQILGNLLSNAIKYTPRGGRVDIRSAVRSDGAAPGPGAWITVEVADTGPGIAEADRENVFLEFSRLEPGARHGAGLGLAISRQVARLLGGEITLESEVGRGSTFTLWLPTSTAAQTRETRRAA